MSRGIDEDSFPETWKRREMFKLEFKTDNAAFDTPYREWPLCWVLDDVRHKVGLGMKEGPVKDSNGNTIGHFELTED